MPPCSGKRSPESRSTALINLSNLDSILNDFNHKQGNDNNVRTDTLIAIKRKVGTDKKNTARVSRLNMVFPLVTSQTKEKALKSMRNIVSANLKPHIEEEELEKQILLMETI